MERRSAADEEENGSRWALPRVTKSAFSGHLLSSFKALLDSNSGTVSGAIPQRVVLRSESAGDIHGLLSGCVFCSAHHVLLRQLLPEGNPPSGVESESNMRLYPVTNAFKYASQPLCNCGG